MIVDSIKNKNQKRLQNKTFITKQTCNCTNYRTEGYNIVGNQILIIASIFYYFVSCLYLFTLKVGVGKINGRLISNNN